jgi:hypothetical protein
MAATTWIGIDPGLGGGIAVIDALRVVLSTMPVTAGRVDGKEIKKLLNLDAVFNRPQCSVAIEKAQAMPKNGAVSMFNYGFSTGVVWGVFESWEPMRIVMVPPRVWQKEIWSAAGVDGDLDPKGKSLQAAMRLFPHVNFRATERCKKAHDGMVDALLIAEWAKRQP